MVQNPIYDGPVYESVQTHFDSLTAQVTAATSADNSCSKCPSLNASAPLDNATDKNRYISQPGIIEPVTNEHPELCNRECLAGASTLGSNNDSVVPQSKFSINS